jgi:YggT family protein
MNGRMELKFVIVFVLQFINLYRWLLLGRILLSWFPNLDWQTQPWRAIFDVTEPMMAPFRRLIPPIGGVVDISPIVLFLVLDLLRSVIASMANL